MELVTSFGVIGQWYQRSQFVQNWATMKFYCINMYVCGSIGGKWWSLCNKNIFFRLWSLEQWLPSKYVTGFQIKNLQTQSYHLTIFTACTLTLLIQTDGSSLQELVLIKFARKLLKPYGGRQRGAVDVMLTVKKLAIKHKLERC